MQLRQQPVANRDGKQLDLETALEELPMEEPEPDTEGQLKPLDLDSTQDQPSLWWLKGLPWIW